MMPQIINVCTRSGFAVKCLMRLLSSLLSEAVSFNMKFLLNSLMKYKSLQGTALPEICRCRLRNLPQVENPVKQNYFLIAWVLEIIP